MAPSESGSDLWNRRAPPLSCEASAVGNPAIQGSAPIPIALIGKHHCRLASNPSLKSGKTCSRAVTAGASRAALAPARFAEMPTMFVRFCVCHCDFTTPSSS